jgi:hypothetical protein
LRAPHCFVPSLLRSPTERPPSPPRRSHVLAAGRSSPGQHRAAH